MKTKHILASVAVLAVSMLSSCFSSKIFMPTEMEIALTMENVHVSSRFRNLNKEISLEVKSNVLPEDMYDDEMLNPTARKILPKYKFTPSVDRFAKSATTSYMRQLGFDVASVGDYRLIIDVKTLYYSWLDKTSGQTKASLSYKLVNEAGETVISPTTVSAVHELASNEVLGSGMGTAYAMALEKIDWDRIAEFLTIAKQPKQKKNAMVSGEGDTALEQTVIRWYITSTPQGADVSWRVVSSTPDVKNTNSNYVGTTPYETTESFDIKGLTYNNSGNVQVEITCERPGYLPQKKRFNIRQAIDQKEISAKFNLIKDE